MKKNSKRSISLLASVLVIALSVITVAAYLFINLDPLTNNFQAAVAQDPTVLNTDGKYSVQVPNNGYAVYVRAAIVVNWKTEDGTKILGDVPVPGVDYTLTTNSTEWFKGSDGFYYLKSMIIPPEGTEPVNTSVLIEEFKKLKGSIMYDDADLDDIKDEYFLNIDIISQTIQALGTTDAVSLEYPNGKPAVVDAWHVTMTGDLITGPVATD